MGDPQLLQDLSWDQVADYLTRDTRVIVPVGSTEQHGRFAPLGTDGYVAWTLAEDVSARSQVIAAPLLWFGWSPHHMVCPGTITVRPEILLELLTDILRSLAHHGFRQFLVINGHRIANLPWIQLACDRIQRELGVTIALADPAQLSVEVTDELDFGPFGHGDDIEISHMLFRYPDLVHLDRAVDSPPAARPLRHVDPARPKDTLCYLPASDAAMQQLLEVTGDAIAGLPTRSTVDKGEQYHEHVVAHLLDALAGLLDD